MIKPVFIIAFSGHRPKANVTGRSLNELAACRSLIQKALLDFKQKAERINGTIHLLVSAAEGSDLIACDVARENNIPVHIILPLPENEFLKDFAEGSEAREKARSVIHAAQQGEMGATLRVADATHRPDCYAETNLQMIFSADALIVLWNGETAMGKGGTAEVWEDACRRNLPRIHINPATNAVESTDTDTLTASSNPFSGMKLLDQLNTYLAQDSRPEEPSRLPDYIRQFNRAADRLGDKSKNTLFWATLLHGAAAIFGAAGISYALAAGMFSMQVLVYVSILEVILIGCAEWLHFTHHKKHRGPRWINCRFATELIRPLRIILPYIDPLSPQIQKQHPQWRRYVVSVCLSEPTVSPLELQLAKDHYIKQRIEDPDSILRENGKPNLEPQIHYFRAFKKRAENRLRIIRPLMKYSGIAALLVVMIAVYYKGVGLSWNLWPLREIHHGSGFSVTSFFIYLLPVMLPLIAGIVMALRQSLDLGRRSLRYGHMIDALELAKCNIQSANTPRSFQRAVSETELLLLSELTEFELSQRIGLDH